MKAFGNRYSRNDGERRRARAQAHLARRRGRGQVQGQGRRRLRRGPRVLMAALAGLAGFAFGGPVIDMLLIGQEATVQTLAVRGASELLPAAIASRSGIETSAKVAELDEEAVILALEAEPWIESARILPLPGGAVLVDVTERIAAATIGDADHLHVVDSDGFAFASIANGEHPELPRIRAQQTPTDAADPRIAQAIELAALLPAYGISTRASIFVAAEDDPKGYALELPGIPARIILGQHPETRLAPLAELVAQRPDVVAMATELDLRFANQVVLQTAPTRSESAHNAAARGHGKPQSGPPTG